MLKLSLPGSTEEFRRTFKEWLATHSPPKPSDSSLKEFIELGRKWQQSLASGGWIGVHWPEEYGGKGLSLVEEAIVQEELTRIGAPQLLGLFGLTMVGPVLIKHGSKEQKNRYLSKILRAEEIWCQGFSEPGAGSDLAAIKTRAVVADNGFHVSGQKVWTSFAQIADWCFLLARTSDEPSKHAGLSYLLVPMKSKGITVRPLKQISGDEEFNEVFFDNVFVPKENVVGNVGEGWKIAISTLMYERVVLTFARQLQSEVALRGLIERFGKKVDDRGRFSLANEVVAACAVRALSYRHLVEYASGKAPGPEGSLDKLLWSESFQRLCRLALDLLGENALASESDPAHGVDIHRYLYSRGRTIAAGTSEIQRSIIAERVLGLPRGKLTI
ncbi:MAG: acyl-CoA dehydrogenase family protein [Deltaproteobacteria bacterium]|nr:acyl-CoA dehydrogenase family protein [Deltaproteobacteria bacterium]